MSRVQRLVDELNLGDFEDSICTLEVMAEGLLRSTFQCLRSSEPRETSQIGLFSERGRMYAPAKANERHEPELTCAFPHFEQNLASGSILAPQNMQ